MGAYGSGHINRNGYRVVHRNGRSVLEHRWLTEQELGRKLHRNEHVHHRNGNKLDNRRENRQLLSASRHSAHHATENWKIALHRHRRCRHTRVCPACQASFSGNAQQKYCCRRCKNRLNMRAFYHRHRQRLRAQLRARYDANPEKFIASNRAYYQKHAETLRAWARTYYATHATARRTYNRAYQRKHRDRLKIYYRQRYLSRKRNASKTSQ